MDLIKTQLIESVFAGGGEVGARMRAHDWTQSVLGPLEQWPQSLRACVRVMLGSDMHQNHIARTSEIGRAGRLHLTGLYARDSL